MRNDIPQLDRLAHELAGAMPRLDASEQQIAIALYGLIAEGEPVPLDRLADKVSRPTADIAALLKDLPGVFFDDQQRVIGFWGLALFEMPHRLDVTGVELYAWCAWDTLFLPELIGKPINVESQSPVGERRVSLAARADGVGDVVPREAVVSFLRPDGPFDRDVIGSFCHYVHFFASQDDARRWTAEHDNTFVLSIDAAFELGRRTNALKFGDVLRDGA